jgi:hypothetical protein
MYFAVDVLQLNLLSISHCVGKDKKNDSTGVCFGRIYNLAKSFISGSIFTEGSGLHCAKLA